MITLITISGGYFQVKSPLLSEQHQYDADRHQLLTYQEMDKIRTRLMALGVAPELITIFLFLMFLCKFVIKVLKIALIGQLLDE